MHPDKKDRFEELMNQRLYNFETDPAEGLWNNIQKKINGADSTPVRGTDNLYNSKNFIILFFSAAVLSLLVYYVNVNRQTAQLKTTPVQQSATSEAGAPSQIYAAVEPSAGDEKTNTTHDSFSPSFAGPEIKNNPNLSSTKDCGQTNIINTAPSDKEPLENYIPTTTRDTVIENTMAATITTKDSTMEGSKPESLYEKLKKSSKKGSQLFK